MTTNLPAVPAAPARLRCEYLENPLGIDEMAPRLFWQLATDRRGARQAAYQIRVGTKPEGADLWDSGKVASDQSTHVAYAGGKLKSRTKYYWQVKLWDETGAESGWSAPASFETGLLRPTDWTASWITLPLPFDKAVCTPARYLRRAFGTMRTVSRARLYITARGQFIAYLNGQRIGNDVFAPGWSDYAKRQRYLTYDVTSLVTTGKNALGVILGDGWYTGHIAWKPRGNYGQNPALLAQLHIEYADGSLEVIRTDDQWRATAEGPIRASDMLMGETYDARKELKGWTTGGYDDAGWQRVEVSVRDKVPLQAYIGPTVQRTGELTPREAWRTAEGKWIFDLGQNMVGWARLKVRGTPGQEITLRFAEMLNPDRTIYTTNLRKAKATDTYTCSGAAGGSVEIFEPHFTYHGFRYVELSGLAAGQTPGLDTVTGVVAHSATPATGTFNCSSDVLNQLQHNIVWGQKGNFVEVPTDCPQRDERLGWMGDAQVFVRTAAFNAAVAGFFERWMIDVDDAQYPDGAYTHVSPDHRSETDKGCGAGTAAWAEAGIICPWTVYEVYGDTRILERHYDAMKRYMKFLQAKWPDGLRHRNEWTYGDWLAIDSWTPRDLIGVAYWAYTASLMVEIAKALGKDADASRFGNVFNRIKKVFNREFVTPAGRLAGDSQTAYVLALRFNLLDDEKRAAAIAFLTKDIEMRGVLTTGFVGVNLLLPTLSQIGRDDLAYKLLLNERYPSWLYSVKHGATTIWERWDGWTDKKGFQDPGMNSFNHYAYGSCGEWMYAAVAGIDLKAPGYKHAVIHPRLHDGISSAAGSLETLYGTLASAWKRNDGQFVLTVRVPANTTATVMLPASDAGAVTESGQPLAGHPAIGEVTTSGKTLTCRVGAGEYRFVVVLPQEKPATQAA